MPRIVLIVNLLVNKNALTKPMEAATATATAACTPTPSGGWVAAKHAEGMGAAPAGELRD